MKLFSGLREIFLFFSFLLSLSLGLAPLFSLARESSRSFLATIFPHVPRELRTNGKIFAKICARATAEESARRPMAGKGVSLLCGRQEGGWEGGRGRVVSGSLVSRNLRASRGSSVSCRQRQRGSGHQIELQPAARSHKISLLPRSLRVRDLPHLRILRSDAERAGTCGTHSGTRQCSSDAGRSSSRTNSFIPRESKVPRSVPENENFSRSAVPYSRDFEFY